MGATAAVGTVFKVGTKAVGSLSSIGGLSLSADTIDTTALDTEGGYRTFVAGFKDGGEVSISGFFDYGLTSNQAELYTLFQSGEAEEFQIVFPTGIGATWSFSGVVTAFETGVETEDAVSFDSTIKVSGKPTLAATTV